MTTPLPAPQEQNPAGAATVPENSQYGPAKPTLSEERLKAFEKELSETPLFMQSLDDAPEGANDALEALKAIAYEGEPHEVADNFKQQGNECFRAKNWKDAVEFYTKGLAVKCGVKEIDEACYANRAACNLELQNYRRTNLDCAEALKLNPKNVKAWYRSGRACLALDKLPEAADCVEHGLAIEPANSALKTLKTQIAKRQETLDVLDASRRRREEEAKAKEISLKKALAMRGVLQRKTGSKLPDLPSDAAVFLEDPLDPKSTLYFPVIILYPLHAQTDFIKSLPEDATIHSQLEEILSPSNLPPWDEQSEYMHTKVDVLVEKKKYDMHGKPSLSKVGKNITLGKTLSEGKLELINGILSVFVVPKARLQEFVADWKERNPN
ncbi:hypothetical protein ABW19_dt0208632 [Dactylella cylindrospora]|nr:hypothetical protein ABW19_dt0208632 [Dactylella cylindrospora]